MRVGYGLHVEQTQKLIMTPELRQAITVLQLSSLELEVYIEQQMQENPLLELEEEEEIKENMKQEQPERPEQADGSEDSKDSCDMDWQEYFNDRSDLGLPKAERVAAPSEYTYENYVSNALTLLEHLMFQLSISKLSGKSRFIGEYLIGNIDEHGYLQLSAGEAAAHLGVSENQVEAVIKTIQTFDPPGVGARTLQECLLIQVEYLEVKDALVKQIIEKHLMDLAKGKLTRMAQVLGVTIQEVQRAADAVKKLDPKPGRNFSSASDTRYIVPDIVLEKVDGEYIILINDVSAPRITINSTYKNVLNQEREFDPKTRRFVESKLNSAAWLIKSIEQRRLTLYKVANCLVELQRDFLEYGVKYLRPLNLKTVADLVGLHESTISRATSNKYIQTPQGLLEMKFFFSSGLNNSSGSTTSAQSIKKMLQEIVVGEDSKNPYNDQKLAELFKQRGINISRRTVAKYRDELGIAAIRKRKRY